MTPSIHSQGEALRPLVILGRMSDVADLALRRVLRAKRHDQALVVLDYQGCLAGFLTKNNQGHLLQRPLLWCDLANRRKPVAVFRFARTPGMRIALEAFLVHFAHHTEAPVSAAVLERVVDLAWRLAENGTIGLSALTRGLLRPEISGSLRRDPSLASGLDGLSHALDWALRFPGVWAASEGNNSLNFTSTLKAGGTVWIELPGAYFERIEFQLVAWMVEAAILERLISLYGESALDEEAQVQPIVVYGFPPTRPLLFTEHLTGAKQVGLFIFSASHPLPHAARAWFQADADCWVTGAVGRVHAGSAEFTPLETNRLAELTPGEAWARSGVNQKAVTLRVHAPDQDVTLGQHARWHALKQRRLSGVSQFSSAFAEYIPHSPGNIDLYRRLCERENLYSGWLRVKAHNRQSHGSDQVTIEQFASRLDRELDDLVETLSQGLYECRPLKTVAVPKPNGELRKLRIVCVRDRVVQAGCLHLLEPVFEPRFSPYSFGFRPGRSAHHAVALARSLIASGRSWAVTADIHHCFDSLDHDVLLRLLGDAIGDSDLLQLIRHWLCVDVLDFGAIIPSELGVPQGAAISPLLANVYLDPLDKAFEQNGNSFVWYADDYLVLCNHEAEAKSSLQLMAEYLHDVLHLSLKPAKTQYCKIQDGANYLGFRLNQDHSTRRNWITREVALTAI